MAHLAPARSAHCRCAVQRDEAGFGIVELLIAMIFINVAVMVLVSAYSSATVSINRASRITNAGAFADSQMERFRAMSYAWIGLNTSAATDAVYKADTACTAAGRAPTSRRTRASRLPRARPAARSSRTSRSTALPARPIVGPDGKNYRLDTYVRSNQTVAPGVGWTQHITKLVTIVVRDPSAGNHVLAREESDFDNCTGLPDPSGNNAPCQ